jgi:sterol desaturase/sphingolipid hydroxylase (fatty acid hydroxylase superfamily)
MYRLNVLQNQWLILALAGGTALLLATALAFLASWRAGEREASGEARENTSRGPMPWILILTYVTIAVFAVAYVLASAMHAPNW